MALGSFCFLIFAFGVDNLAISIDLLVRIVTMEPTRCDTL